MILGIGNDIIEIARIEALLSRYPEKFLKRVFTPNEQKYCLARKQASRHFAGRFAAKEAIVKALGTGFSDGLNWLDFEIQPNFDGKPLVILSPYANQRFNHPHLLISISHCHEYATAVAIWTSQSPKV